MYRICDHIPCSNTVCAVVINYAINCVYLHGQFELLGIILGRSFQQCQDHILQISLQGVLQRRFQRLQCVGAQFEETLPLGVSKVIHLTFPLAC